MDNSLATSSSQQSMLSRLVLDLRGSRFVIERETLMNLPESVLLCLFPNGLVLSRNGGGGMNDGDGMEEDEEEVYMVDFDPACLSYVLAFFRSAQDDFYGTATTPGRYRAALSPSSSQGDLAQQQQLQAAGMLPLGGPGGNPLLSKQTIIVLREELEYFAIPAKTSPSLKAQQQSGARPDLPPLRAIDHSLPDAAAALAALEQAYDPDQNEETTNLVTGAPTEKLLLLKHKAGQALLERRHIFTALQRNVNKENNLAEQHLIDMLCMSGFDRSDTWGFRAVEPARCCITSIALVLLKTGITHAGDSKGLEAIAAQAQADDSAAADPTVVAVPQYVDGPGGMKIDQNQLATAQKLLLFWRKPARKCWWDGVDVVVPIDAAADNTSGSNGGFAAASVPSSTAASTPPADGAHAVPGAEASPTAGMTANELELFRSGKGRKVRVWARRVWTLELSLI
ncbi:hypothetical protein K437DRAFT_258695 [Tilletiaria anomala UBC 951]|uniref:Phosphatase activator n=1 Tax=Tilletiaria anomala (strain ATCC 24038 / CBS 436.72 / UBC 951) TaxID=1037660 RepID=A0A066VJA5_TILAU|nr:uncharacterized protein K437DRAFT_258695 [Tilletiaria anomala UBC 951]KDN40358.1 hypothetical protein K437DRAFT_258695 [Tilletiaria anomala UBC 951]